MPLHTVRYILKTGRVYTSTVEGKDCVVSTDDFKSTTIHRLLDGKKNTFVVGDRLDCIEIDIEALDADK